MWEIKCIVSWCVLFLQISFINTKSQLFTLQNNNIVMLKNNQDIDNLLDKNTETFYIISSTDEKNGNFWVKDDGDTYEFAFDSMTEYLRIKSYFCS